MLRAFGVLVHWGIGNQWYQISVLLIFMHHSDGEDISTINNQPIGRYRDYKKQLTLVINALNSHLAITRIHCRSQKVERVDFQNKGQST